MPRMWSDFLLQTWPQLFVITTGFVLALAQIRRQRRIANILLVAMSLNVAHLLYLPMVYGYYRTSRPSIAAIPLLEVHQLVAQLLFVAWATLLLGAVFAGRRGQ